MAFAIIAEHLSANEPLRAVVNSGWTRGVASCAATAAAKICAPGMHFKPLQRYNACGTGTSCQFGNRYTGDHVAL